MPRSASSCKHFERIRGGIKKKREYERGKNKYRYTPRVSRILDLVFRMVKQSTFCFVGLPDRAIRMLNRAGSRFI